MVDGELAVQNLLEVLADVTQTQMQALQRLQLRGYPGGKGAHCNVTDVSKKVLDADFLGFLRLDGRWGVDKGLGSSRAVL